MRLFLLLLIAPLAGCGGAGGDTLAQGFLRMPRPGPAVPPPTDFVEEVDHPYLPLVPGTVLVYEGDDEGRERRDEVRVQREPETVQGVACTTLVQQVLLDGDLAEETTEWYAQDRNGNVWKFGEQSVEYDEGVPVGTTDSWQAGVAGARPWLFLGFGPRPGDVYNGVFPGGAEVVRVVSIDALASVPAGAFVGCLEVLENGEDVEDLDRIIYAPGVGLVSEATSSGRIELTEMRVE